MCVLASYSLNYIHSLLVYDMINCQIMKNTLAPKKRVMGEIIKTTGRNIWEFLLSFTVDVGCTLGNGINNSLEV